MPDPAASQLPSLRACGLLNSGQLPDPGTVSSLVDLDGPVPDCHVLGF